MGGRIEWPSLNDIAEYLNVKDAELFIDALLVLQEHSRQPSE